MNMYLKNYKTYFRLAKVVCVEEYEKQNDNFERLIISRNNMFFTSDEYAIDKINYDNLKNLKTNDIVSIRESGLIYKLYSHEEYDATIYITGHCNSNCIMCPTTDWERQNSEGLSVKYLISYIEMLPEYIRYIIITGGEPTLKIKTLNAVMERIKERFPYVNVLLLTNGRTLSIESVMKTLISVAVNNLCVAIPLHAADSNLHDKITRAKGSFYQTDIAIRRLLTSNIDVEIRIVVSKLNCENINRIAHLICNDYSNIKLVTFIGLETRGNCAKNYNEVFLDYNAVFKYIKKAVVVLLQHGIDVALYNFPLCMVESGYWSLCRKSITPEKVKYHAECVKCNVKNSCGGFFETTFSMSKPIVYLIIS